MGKTPTTATTTKQELSFIEDLGASKSSFQYRSNVSLGREINRELRLRAPRFQSHHAHNTQAVLL